MTTKPVYKIPKARLNFIREYIALDFTNAAEAYRRAYPNGDPKNANASAARLLAQASIQTAVADELSAVLKDARVPLEKRILDTWVRRAFYDPSDILSEDGDLTEDFASLKSKGLTVCIDQIDKRLDKDGGEHVVYILTDRNKALDMLRQYVQMIEAPKQRLVIENITIGEPPKPADLGAEDGGDA